jgi:ribosomal protein S15P/S13E
MPKKKEEKNAEETKKSKKLSNDEFEKKVIELAEKGMTSEKIGEALRRGGIHSKEFGKKISKILGNKYVNPDEANIQKKLEKIEKHFGENHKDKRAMRDRERVSSKLRRLRKYLKKI